MVKQILATRQASFGPTIAHPWGAIAIANRTPGSVLGRLLLVVVESGAKRRRVGVVTVRDMVLALSLGIEFQEKAAVCGVYEFSADRSQPRESLRYLSDCECFHVRAWS